VLLTNAHIAYRRFCIDEGLDEKELLSHHDFLKDIAFAWINPKEYEKDQIQNNH